MFLLIISFVFGYFLILNWEETDWVERIVMGFGIGLSCLPLLGAFFNLIKIPINYFQFCLFTLLFIILVVIFKRKKIKQSILMTALTKFTSNMGFNIFCRKKSDELKYLVYTALFLLFGITAFMYIYGSFSTPHFENSDPWQYAYASKYIADKQTFTSDWYYDHFSEPYPQGYQIVMGLMHQLNPDVYFNMKFFHNLIIACSLLFFFFFMKSITKNDYASLAMTFCLFAIPCWFSRFVFSLSFNMTLGLVFFYCLSKKNKQGFSFASSLILASIFITHFYTAIIILVMTLLYWVAEVYCTEQFNRGTIKVIVLGILFSAIFWIPVSMRHAQVILSGEQLGGINVFVAHPMLFFAIIASLIGFFLVELFFSNKINNLIEKTSSFKYYILISVLTLITFLLIFLPKIFYSAGSGDAVYRIIDFVIAQPYNMTNNPIGIGIVLSILLIIGFWINIRKERINNYFISTLSILWLFFTIIGVNGKSLAIGFVPFRMWTFLAIPVSMIAGWSFYNIILLVQKHKINIKYSQFITNSLIVIVIALLAFGIYTTSFKQKYIFNNAYWQEHKILEPNSESLYETLRSSQIIPKSAKVKALCHPPFVILGYGFLDDSWDSLERTDYYYFFLNESVEQNYNFLKANGYEYAIIDYGCVAKFKQSHEDYANKVNNFLNSSNFKVVYGTQTAFLFEVK